LGEAAGPAGEASPAGGYVWHPGGVG
jgi:hypothetical protein